LNTEPLALLYSALSVSVPTFGWVLLGLLLRRIGLVSAALIGTVSRLAFNYGLPLMLFTSAAQVDYSALGSARYLAAGALGTFLTLTLAWCYSRWRDHPRALQGIFVQAAFRSNLAIVGLGLAVSAYGERGPLLTVLLALVMGVRDEHLGVLFLLTASPVAAASFVMVVAARGDGVLAANIVVLTTLLSIVTVTLGFFLLSMFALVGQPG
jgi:predicted permease